MIKHAVDVRGGGKNHKMLPRGVRHTLNREQFGTAGEWPSYFGIRNPLASLKDYNFYQKQQVAYRI